MYICLQTNIGHMSKHFSEGGGFAANCVSSIYILSTELVCPLVSLQELLGAGWKSPVAETLLQ